MCLYVYRFTVSKCTFLSLAIAICGLCVTACGGGAEQTPEASQKDVRETVQDMTTLTVPDDFDWKLTRDITLEVDFVNTAGEALVGQKVEVYVGVPPGSVSIPESASLLFRGRSNLQGRVSLLHRVKKGAQYLSLKIPGSSENLIVDVPLAEGDFDGATQILAVRVIL